MVALKPGSGLGLGADAACTCLRLQVWLCAIPGVEPQAKNEQMERSSYYVFDTASWEAVRKDNFVSFHADDATCPNPNLPSSKP